jgi:hypothetical protein
MERKWQKKDLAKIEDHIPPDTFPTPPPLDIYSFYSLPFAFVLILFMNISPF